jgi:hypothetical protein
LGSKDLVSKTRARNHLFNVLGVRYVLNAANDVRGADGDTRFTILRANAIDVEGYNIESIFKQSSNFIENAIDKEKVPIYVHCAEGVSRSVTIVLAYMILKRNMTLSASFDAIQKVRWCAQPNISFWQQLIKLDGRIHNKISCNCEEYVINKLGYTKEVATRLLKGTVPLRIERKTEKCAAHTTTDTTDTDTDTADTTTADTTTADTTSATTATTTAAAAAAEKMPVVIEIDRIKNVNTCEKWWSSGTCKFENTCRFLHDVTTSMSCPNIHEHIIGRDTNKKRKKNKCNQCNQKTKMSGYRCQSGCDWDICIDCMHLMLKV